MQARLYHCEDAPTLDKILSGNVGHDVRLDRDRLVVLGRRGHPVSLLAWRSGAIVHELHVGDGLGQKRRADLLVQYALRDAASQHWQLHEGIFITDSDRMASYAIDIGAVEQTGKRVFTLAL